MKTYLRALSVLYFLGGLLHVLDLFDLRLEFSTMPPAWQSWIVYLTIFDLLAAIGLWRETNWGIRLFWLVACSQLIAYVGFSGYFGKQHELIAFHLITLGIYVYIRRFSEPRRNNVQSSESSHTSLDLIHPCKLLSLLDSNRLYHQQTRIVLAPKSLELFQRHESN